MAPRRPAGYPVGDMWDVILGVILAVMCGLIGLLGATLVGYYLLRLFGVARLTGQAGRWAVLGFGLPVGIVGLLYGYRLGVTLVHV